MLGRVTTYLSFLEHARCPVRGFHNFLSYQRDWLDAEGTGDSQGQAVRALAEVLGSSLPAGYRELARELIDAVTPALADLRSLRAQAYVILAWGHLSMSGVKDLEAVESVARSAAQRLVECYHRSQRPDWPWFESRMTYANAVLPHALFVAARCWPEEDFLDVAEASFAFLTRDHRHRRGRESFAGTARDQPAVGARLAQIPTPFSSGRLETTIGIPAEKKNRCTISSRWRRSPWPTPRWPDLRCWAMWAVKSTWVRFVAPTIGFMAGTAFTSRWPMSTAARAMTVCSGRA